MQLFRVSRIYFILFLTIIVGSGFVHFFQQRKINDLHAKLIETEKKVISETETIETSQEKSPVNGRSLSEDYFNPTTWQTYKNKEYGFTIKFPKDWVITTEAERSGMFVDGDIHFTIEDQNSPYDGGGWESCNLSVLKSDLPLEQWIKENHGQERLVSIFSQEQYKRVYPSLLEGIKVYTSGPNVTSAESYFVKKNGRIYTFGYLTGGDFNYRGILVQYREICETMLETLII